MMLHLNSWQRTMRAAVITFTICSAVPQSFAANAAIEWNRISTDITATGSDAVRETRVLAITQIAIHDALNAMTRRYAPYAWDRQVSSGSADAAIAAAAREVLVALVPSKSAEVEAAYQQRLAVIPDGEPKQNGINAGKRSAAIILAQRANDGADRRGSARTGSQPGEYRPTPPNSIPGFLPEWGRVQPFALRTSSQFRPQPPYRLGTPEYTNDYNEVALIGKDDSRWRSEEASQIAKYWYENSGAGWNRVARNVAEAKQLDNWEAARLLALVNIAMADGFIGGFEAKYHYNYWRPVTAIRDGDVDGIDETAGQYDWTPFLVTPPVPDYPSTHSVLGAAAARVLARFFGTDYVDFSMTSGQPYANITRNFFSFSQAAAENAHSRVLAGIHFANACRAGLWQGEGIGEFTYNNYLRPVR